MLIPQLFSNKNMVMHRMCVYRYEAKVSNLISTGSHFTLECKKGWVKAVTHCKSSVPFKGQSWAVTNTHQTAAKLPFSSPHILTNAALTPSPHTSCPSSFPPLLPLFIPPHHCPSSSTYLILFADSPQPLVPLFLKEKELKLAGEMNNVPAINSGTKGSVFSCVWGGEEMRCWRGEVVVVVVVVWSLSFLSNFCSDCSRGRSRKGEEQVQFNHNP